MKIALLCTSPSHPVVPALRGWQQRMQAAGHQVELLHDKSELGDGDVLFLVSCGQIIGPALRRHFRATLVLHASDLPTGRGWSPHIWSIVRGASTIVVSLLEAADPVDTGPIWLKTRFTLEGHELLAEINEKLFAAELHLMSEAVARFDEIEPQPQQGSGGEYLRLRTPDDSRLDPQSSIAAQFDLLRVVDNQRYPAFFEWRGKRYVLRIEKDES